MLRGPLCAGLACALVVGDPALAQTVAPSQAPGQATAPSSITPGTLRPPPTGGDGATVLAPSDGLIPPPGTAGLTVALSTLEVEGGFPEVAAETAAIAARLVHRTVTLGEIYAAASAVEAAHVRAGYVLARVVVPPQTLSAGGPVRIVVIDGFFESVDASGLPTRVRRAALGRVAALAGRRHLTLAQIEQPLVLAGDLPGLRLTSTLARGTQGGGARLLLGGRQALVSGSVSAGNYFARSLGGYGVNAQVSLNSAFGLGEQVYGFATSGYDLARAVRSDAPVRVLGGGVVVPTGDGRAFLNPEVTFSRTQPFPQAGVPRTRGQLRRLSLRGGYTLARARTRSVTLGATLERIEESNDAIDFATRLGLDRFTVARVQANYSTGFAAGGGVALVAELSRGLGGRDVRGAVDPNAPAASRQGAGPYFNKLAASARVLRPDGHGFQATLIAKGQTSFGQPLFRSEQSTLEGRDALSAYVGGVTAVDESITGRVEVAHGYAVSAKHRSLDLLPYVFGAAGKGRVARATAIEADTLVLGSAGAGVRGTIPRTGITFDLEYARGFAHRPIFDGVDRLSFAVAKSF